MILLNMILISFETNQKNVIHEYVMPINKLAVDGSITLTCI